MRTALLLFWRLLAALSLAGCTILPLTPPAEHAKLAPARPIAIPTPAPVTLLPVGPPFDDANLELSGLAWFGDVLVLLPQYPGRFDNQLFGLSRQALLAAVDGAGSQEVEPQGIVLDDGGLARTIPGFEGYEAITFDGTDAYLIVEAHGASSMMGYLVRGEMAIDGSALRLDPESSIALLPPAALPNASFEAVTLAGDQVVVLFEANGAQVNPAPAARRLNADLSPAGDLAFPTIEYRITDATSLDGAGRFWAINFFFPGDTHLLPPVGEGEQESPPAPVEQLLEFELAGGAILRTARAPIQLELLDDGTARNWEGIARLGDRGFVLVTDKFPTTLVAFVPFVQE